MVGGWEGERTKSQVQRWLLNTLKDESDGQAVATDWPVSGS